MDANLLLRYQEELTASTEPEIFKKFVGYLNAQVTWKIAYTSFSVGVII